eukprot:gene10343-12231_t
MALCVVFSRQRVQTRKENRHRLPVGFPVVVASEDAPIHQACAYDRFDDDSDDEGANAARKRALEMLHAMRRTPSTSEQVSAKAPASDDPNPNPKKPELSSAISTAVTAEQYRQNMNISSPHGDRTLWPDPLQTLDQLPFNPKIVTLLRQAGIVAPSAIQAQSWPLVLTGQDLVAVAQTGSGKTLGYLLPLLHLLSQKGKKVRSAKVAKLPAVLILAPTRELVVQIHVESKKFGKAVGISSCCVYGGVPKAPQVYDLKLAPLVVVATPGRLHDLIESGSTSLSHVAHVVLDEADRLLEMGFQEDIEHLLDQIPTPRQTVCYTATWPRSVEKVALKYVSPSAPHLTLNVSNHAATTTNITQEFCKLERDEEKVEKLRSISDNLLQGGKMIVFVNTKR